MCIIRTGHGLLALCVDGLVGEDFIKSALVILTFYEIFMDAARTPTHTHKAARQEIETLFIVCERG